MKTKTSKPATPFRCAAATVADVFDWYRANSPTRIQTGTGERERLRLYKMLAEVIGPVSCSECRPHHLLTFINERASENAWTRRRWNATLQRPFNYATRLGLIPNNPFKGLAFPEGENGRDWTDDEYRALLRAAKPHMRRVIVMIRFSGMRPGEVRGLEWKHVDVAAGAIVLDKHKTVAKTKKSRLIPLNTVTVKLLAWLRRNHLPRARQIFLNSFFRPWSCKALTKTVQAIREKVGLGDDVKLHGGRHTFATGAILAGVDVGTLAELLGHGRIMTTQRYVHLAGKVDHLSDAMERAIHGARQK